jgi:ABC-2 type transport system permease protein
MSELALRFPAVMVGRSLRMSCRNVEAMITALLLPVMLMLVFTYLFGGAIETGTKYVTYVVPGTILLCAGFGASTTAVTVSADLAGGIVDRFRSMNVGGASILTGHVVASTVRNLVSTALVFAVGFAIGFRPHATIVDWLVVLGVLGAYIAAISWFSAAVGMLARAPEAASGFTFLVMFLPYASSAFVPVSTMPSWLRGFADHQPITVVVETLRGRLLDLPGTGDAPLALLWCGGILLASVLLSSVLFRVRTR